MDQISVRWELYMQKYTRQSMIIGEKDRLQNTDSVTN